MADYAVHRLRHNGRIIEPGEEVHGLTDAEWKRLHALKAIRSEMHPVELVAAEVEELEVFEPEGLEASGSESPTSEEEVSEEVSIPEFQLDAAESVVDPEKKSGKRKRSVGST